MNVYTVKRMDDHALNPVYMITILKTAERTHNHTFSNNYIFQRHVFAYMAIPNEHIAGKHILEVGCGEGYGMEMIGDPAASYLAVDKIRPAGVSFNRKVRFQSCHLPSLAGMKDEQFDTVICFQVIEHVKEDHQLIREMKRVLKPGGTLFLTTPNILSSLTRNPFHVREYLPVQMQQLINQHFITAEIYGVYGNDLVKEYLRLNKKHVERLLQYDLLNLQHNLPAFLLRGLYSVANNFNRLLIARKMPDITAGIHYHDFRMGRLESDCLDYFVQAIK